MHVCARQRERLFAKALARRVSSRIAVALRCGCPLLSLLPLGIGHLDSAGSFQFPAVAVRRGPREREKKKETSVNFDLFSRVTNGVVRKVAVVTIVNPSLPRARCTTRDASRVSKYPVRNTLIRPCSARTLTNGRCKVVVGRVTTRHAGFPERKIDIASGEVAIFVPFSHTIGCAIVIFTISPSKKKKKRKKKTFTRPVKRATYFTCVGI